MGSVYVFGKDIADKSVYILSNIPIDNLDIVWRYGIFKTTSLTYHAYVLGLFNLLILTIYFHTEKRAKIKTVIPLISGVLASVSRMAYAGLIVVILLQLIQKKKWILLLFLILAGILVINNLTHVKNDNTGIRAETRQTALEIWKDHTIWGVGSGMFGGIVASKYNSYIYSEYNVANLAYINKVGGIEQFWFQILAEMGIAGALLFINLIVMLFLTLYKLREHAMSQDMKNLFSGLIIYIPCILIVTIGSGLNIASMLFTYCAFVGIGLGSFNNFPESE